MKWGGKGKQEEKGKQEKKDKQEKKERGKKGTLLRLGGYLMHYKWYLAAALLLTVGSNLFALIWTLSPCRVAVFLFSGG